MTLPLIYVIGKTGNIGISHHYANPVTRKRNRFGLRQNLYQYQVIYNVKLFKVMKGGVIYGYKTRSKEDSGING